MRNVLLFRCSLIIRNTNTIRQSFVMHAMKMPRESKYSDRRQLSRHMFSKLMKMLNECGSCKTKWTKKNLVLTPDTSHVIQELVRVVLCVFFILVSFIRIIYRYIRRYVNTTLKNVYILRINSYLAVVACWSMWLCSVTKPVSLRFLKSNVR